MTVRNDSEEGGRRRRKEARPAEIVEAARAVFVERGFGDAKVDEIARRAGASKGTVYLYYPTKEALFEAVMRTNVLSIIEGAGALMAASDMPAPAQIRFLLTTLYRELIGTDRRRLIHLVIAEGPRFPSVLEFYHREVIERGKAIMTAVIERGIARGEFQATGIERHPKIVIGPALAAGLYLNLFDANDPLDLESYAETHIAGVLRMLGAKEGE